MNIKLNSFLLHCLLGILLVPFLYACNNQPPKILIPRLCENGKYGYVDQNGKEWIEGKYDAAEEFAEDLAVVKMGNYFGYIDRTGEIVIPLNYTDAQSFSGGRAKVAKDHLYGYIDTDNAEIIPCIYTDIRPFTSTLAFAYLGKKVGIIDYAGKVLVPVKYDGITQINEGLYAVNIGIQYGFLNGQWNEILPCRYGYNITQTQSGNELISLRTQFDPHPISFSGQKNKYGLMDMSGNVLAECKYEKMGSFANSDLAYVILNEKIGYINTEGTEVVPPIYDYSRTLSPDRYALFKGDCCHLIDCHTGKRVTDKEFTSIKKHRDSLFQVKVNDKFGMIDSDGNYVLDPIYEKMHETMEGWLKLVVKTDQGRYFSGIATPDDAKIVIPCDRYLSIERFEVGGGNYARVKKEVAEYTYKEGLVNRAGKEVVPCEYQYVYTVENGQCLVGHPRKWVKLNE